MADTFNFWSHGVTVVPQHTPHLTGDENGLFMMPLSWGTVTRQDHGTSNWFHIPLITPSYLDDWPAYHHHAWLRVRVGDHAEIDKINVFSNPRISQPGREDAINPVSSFELRGREEEVHIDLHDHKARGPLVMSVHVQFDGDGAADQREVLFAGAGVSYEERR